MMAKQHPLTTNSGGAGSAEVADPAPPSHRVLIIVFPSSQQQSRGLLVLFSGCCLPQSGPYEVVNVILMERFGSVMLLAERNGESIETFVSVAASAVC
jgi:hypothetical protein